LSNNANSSYYLLNYSHYFSIFQVYIILACSAYDTLYGLITMTISHIYIYIVIYIVPT